MAKKKIEKKVVENPVVVEATVVVVEAPVECVLDSVHDNIVHCNDQTNEGTVN